MSTELTVHAVQQGDMRVIAKAGQFTLNIDYPMPPYTTETIGPTPLQMLLASLAACATNSLAYLMRSKEVHFSGLEVTAHGPRRQEHPTVITQITLEFVVKGNNLDLGEINNLLRLSEERFCPVWNMLKQTTPITAAVRIEQE